MRLHRLASLALVALVFAPGCQVYFGDDDDDCARGATEPYYPGAGYVDPATLECKYFGGGGGGNCGEPWAGDTAPPSIDWGTCQSACTGLAEADCLASDACRGVYVQLEVFDPTQQIEVFQACYPTAPSGPVSGPTCAGLNAQECSRHNDCIAVHASVPGDFQFCDRERGVCDPTTVPPPPPPQLLRDPESGQCVTFGGGGGGGCNGATPDAPGTGVDVPAHQDFGVCGSPCESLDEATCRIADGCRVIYANQYPPNVDAIGYVFETCWPTAPSGPVRGGTCEGLDAHECSRHDDCMARHDSDWSGCNDFANCDYVAGHFDSCAAETAPPPPPPACNTLGEAACDGRDDCTPLYAGSDCHCSASGCTCDTWTFDSCQAD